MLRSPHIPAWKRLGLQLKNPPGGTGDVNHIVAVEPAQKKRKLINGEYNSKVPQKDYNISGLIGSAVTRNAGQVPKSKLNKSELQDNQASNNSAPETLIHRAVNRKSVTFTSEAKVVDGLQDPLIYPTKGEHFAESDAKLVKKDKKKLRRVKYGSNINHSTPSRQSHSKINSEYRPPYLQYLDCYYNRRSTWKFSKIHQTHVLKNIFHIDHIPPVYDQALFAYVAGLQGQAARSRLKESAQAILAEQDQDLASQQSVVNLATAAEMEVAAAQEQALEAARKKDVRKVKRALDDEELVLTEQSPEHKFKLAKRVRAENIILALAEQPGESAPNQPEPMAHGGGQTQTYDTKLRRTSRGRKWRTTTGVPDDDRISSSSSEEPSSDESSSGDNSDAASEDGEDHSDGEDTSDGENDSSVSVSSDTVSGYGSAHKAIESSQSLTSGSGKQSGPL